METAQQVDYRALVMLRQAFATLPDEQLAAGVAVIALTHTICQSQGRKVSFGFAEVNAVIQDVHLKRCLERDSDDAATA